MIIWINGAFGSGKTTTAIEIERRLKNSFLYDPENIGYFLRRNMPKEIWAVDDFQDETLDNKHFRSPRGAAIALTPRGPAC